MTAATLHLPLFVGFPNGFGNVRLYVLSPNYSIFWGSYLNVCPRPQGNLHFIVILRPQEHFLKYRR